MSVLQRLYDSEINFQISTFWDAGFDVYLGNNYGGFLAEENFRTFDEATAWLGEAAIKHYPNSKFARESQKAA